MYQVLVMLAGFGQAPTKDEGAAVAHDAAGEAFTARYTHETIDLAFAIAKETAEGNVYDKHSTHYTRALARSMANTKQVKAAAVLDNAFSDRARYASGTKLLFDVDKCTGLNDGALEFFSTLPYLIHTIGRHVVSGRLSVQCHMPSAFRVHPPASCLPRLCARAISIKLTMSELYAEATIDMPRA